MQFSHLKNSLIYKTVTRQLSCNDLNVWSMRYWSEAEGRRGHQTGFYREHTTLKKNKSEDFFQCCDRKFLFYLGQVIISEYKIVFLGIHL